MKEHSKKTKTVSMRFLIFTLLFATITGSTYASQNKKTVRLRLQAQNGYLDEATVYFDQGVSPTYAYQEDAQLVLSGVTGVPVIYSVTTDSILCSINGYGPLSGTEVVPLGVMTDKSGNFNLTAALLDNFDATSIITLEDRTTGRSVDLRTNFYQCHIDSGAQPEGRFFIHVSYASAFSSTVAGCDNNDGQLQISCDPSITWDSYILFDAYNNPLDTFLNVNAPVTFTGLPEGDYYVVRVYGAYSTTQTYHVAGNHIVASIGASAIQVATGENISFTANATHANHFSWDFGDGTLINGVAHPDLSYYTPGVYTVDLICSNDHGCSEEATIQITVSQAIASGITEETAKDASITTQGKNVQVIINGPINPDAQLKVFNLLGQQVSTANINADKTIVDLNEQAMGYYIASVKNNDKVSTKRIFITQ